MSTPTAAVIGAGIGGLTAAVALRAKGIDAEIYEAAPGPRASTTALGLASNATKVLRSLGIDLVTQASCCALERFEFRTARGELIRALPGAAITAQLGHPFVSIHRNELIRVLTRAAADTPVHYGAEVIDVGADRSGARATCTDGTEIRAEILVGADGLRSAVRSSATGQRPPNQHGYVCWLATVPFAHPRFVPGYTGHYWGRGQRFGLIDIGGGTAYWWATRNMPTDRAREWNGDKAEIVAAFAGWAPEVIEVIARTPPDTILAVPGQDRPFLKHWGTGPITLLGDAAHPMLTSRSQGASSAVEDGYVLAEALAHIQDAVEALRAYERARRRRTAMLVRSSRRLNRMEQLHNPLACAARNLAVRHTPARSLLRNTVRPMRFDLGWQGR